MSKIGSIILALKKAHTEGKIATGLPIPLQELLQAIPPVPEELLTKVDELLNNPTVNSFVQEVQTCFQQASEVVTEDTEIASLNDKLTQDKENETKQKFEKTEFLKKKPQLAPSIILELKYTYFWNLMLKKNEARIQKIIQFNREMYQKEKKAFEKWVKAMNEYCENEQAKEKEFIKSALEAEARNAQDAIAGSSFDAIINELEKTRDQIAGAITISNDILNILRSNQQAIQEDLIDANEDVAALEKEWAEEQELAEAEGREPDQILRDMLEFSRNHRDYLREAIEDNAQQEVQLQEINNPLNELLQDIDQELKEIREERDIIFAQDASLQEADFLNQNPNNPNLFEDRNFDFSEFTEKLDQIKSDIESNEKFRQEIESEYKRIRNKEKLTSKQNSVGRAEISEEVVNWIEKQKAYKAKNDEILKNQKELAKQVKQKKQNRNKPKEQSEKLSEKLIGLQQSLSQIKTNSLNQAEREKIVYQAQQGVGEGEISAEKLEQLMSTTTEALEILLNDITEKIILVNTKHGDEIKVLKDKETEISEKINKIFEQMDLISNLSPQEKQEIYNSVIEEKIKAEKEHQDYLKQKEQAKIKSKVSEKSDKHFLTMQKMMKKKRKRDASSRTRPSRKAEF